MAITARAQLLWLFICEFKRVWEKVVMKLSPKMAIDMYDIYKYSVKIAQMTKCSSFVSSLFAHDRLGFWFSPSVPFVEYISILPFIGLKKKAHALF